MARFLPPSGAFPFGLSFSFTNRQTPPKELPLSFDTEPIIGWRLWNVVDFKRRGGVTEPRLQSVASNENVEPRERAVARCENGEHEAPWPDCACGFWAFKDRQTALDAATNYGGFEENVLGEVSLWGRVLECRNGWRGQYAYPKRLVVLTDERRRADRLAEVYGVPVEVEVQPEPETATAAVHFGGYVSAPIPWSSWEGLAQGGPG
jgi:hypothetical protein